jgi:hypothetical protein
MTFASVVVDGAVQAAEIVSRLSLMFALGAGVPAMAATAGPAPVAALTAPAQRATAVPVTLTADHAQAPLSLRARHVEVIALGEQALVRTTLVYRNDGAQAVSAQYRLPQPVQVLGPGALAIAPLEDAPSLVDELLNDPGCGAFDVADGQEHDGGALPAGLAQWLADWAEQGVPVAFEDGSVTLQPGEDVIVRLVNVQDVRVRDGRHRLVLPLPAAQAQSYTPQFTAEVLVDASAPVRRLASLTHGGEVRGLGQRRAQLTLPAGRVYAQRALVIDYELQAEPARDAAAGAGAALAARSAH